MLKLVFRQALLVVASVSLYACGAPSLEEGSAPEYGRTEQSLTSYLTFTRNTASGDTDFTNNASGGPGPYTFYWNTVEYHYADGSTWESGWHQGGSTEYFYCPRAPSRDGEYLWSLRVEAYAVDANGVASAVVYKTLPCSVAQ